MNNCAMQAVLNPAKFDMILAPNLFGGILSSALGGLVGAPGMCAAYYKGGSFRLYSDDLRFKGRGQPNPTGSILSISKMFKHNGFPEFYHRI